MALVLKGLPIDLVTKNDFQYDTFLLNRNVSLHSEEYYLHFCEESTI